MVATPGAQAGAATSWHLPCRPLRCRYPPRGAAALVRLPCGAAAAGRRMLPGSAARASQRGRTCQRAAHPTEEDRPSAAAEWCGGGPNDGHPAGARPDGDRLLSVEQPLLTHPPPRSGGVQGGAYPLPWVHGQGQR